MIADGNLHWPVAFANKLDQQFPVEVEAVAREGEAVQALSAEHFVHGEGILQPQPEGEVDQ